MANFEHFASLPTVRGTFLDGGTLFTADDDSVKTVILGTAAQGVSDVVYNVGAQAFDLTSAKAEFGLEGTLIRTAYEFRTAGNDTLTNGLKLLRIGATPATLEGVGNDGVAAGYTIETTSLADDTANSGVALIYDPATDRLRVYMDKDEDGVIGATAADLVYDNLPTDSGFPGVVGVYDTGDVTVTGTASSGVALGEEGSPLLFAAVEAADPTTTLTEGTDGTALSRMELYEALYKGFRSLENEDVDVVLLPDCYLDDKNIQDLTNAEITQKGLNGLTDYPTAEKDALPGSDLDYLGLLYTQEYNGKQYFWWDTDRDGVAEIFPSVGSASASLNADGTALTAADFHEVNFGYQLANFCFESTYNNAACVGVIGVRPPTSFAASPVSNWVGKLPTYVTNAAGKSVVTVNGTGLLGNKFMAGRLGNSVSGLPGFAIDGTDGLANGGFIATEEGWLDGTQRKDANDKLIDLGKYISVVAAWPALSNVWSDNTLYVASGAASYAGLIQTLPIQQAPTNQAINVLGLPFDLTNAKHNDLASKRYVTFRAKTKGIVVTDAPTAARPLSDYARLSTFRLVKAVLDEVREVADPFIGGVNSAASRAALETAVESKLNDIAAVGVLRDKSVKVTATPQQQVAGDATLRLTLTPAFELRNIDVIVSLSAL